MAELKVDALRSEVTLVLAVNPESGEIDGTIRFAGVRHMEMQYYRDEIDREDMPTLFGTQDVAQEGGRRYITTTDTVELGFLTRVEPVVQWVDPDKPKIPWKPEVIRMDD